MPQRSYHHKVIPAVVGGVGPHIQLSMELVIVLTVSQQAPHLSVHTGAYPHSTLMTTKQPPSPPCYHTVMRVGMCALSGILLRVILRILRKSL